MMENGPETNAEAEIFKDGNKWDRVVPIPPNAPLTYEQVRAKYPQLCEEECLWIWEGEVIESKEKNRESN